MNKENNDLSEACYIDFNKYKKARYEIRVDNNIIYWFVTTTRSQEESIEILSERAKSHLTCNSRGFKIYKIVGKSKEVIYKRKRLTSQ